MQLILKSVAYLGGQLQSKGNINGKIRIFRLFNLFLYEINTYFAVNNVYTVGTGFNYSKSKLQCINQYKLIINRLYEL